MKIEGYSRYSISEKGEILCVPTGKMMSVQAIPGGYLRTNLTSDSGKRKALLVHRLVWMSRFGKIPSKMVINHIDGNKQNNDISNLECVTQSENVKHAWRTGLNTGNTGESNGASKLCESDILAIRANVSKLSNKDLAAEYKVSGTLIGYILSGKNWNHV